MMIVHPLVKKIENNYNVIEQSIFLLDYYFNFKVLNLKKKKQNYNYKTYFKKYISSKKVDCIIKQLIFTLDI